ncbi:hypothetical protein DPMN_064383 [Dreissena polymorpha]|uniref:Uncharacterized protein n=1 Tax=Dreissena polymorpha TaxID=45954 RepID=A0A9D4CD93_DREPO|nr:hypothetical protein DPMN_064383 [Dreissena polymorpha]
MLTTNDERTKHDRQKAIPKAHHEHVVLRPIISLLRDVEKRRVELRNEDPRAFPSLKRMPPAMYDKIVQRLTPALTKET